MHSTHNKGQAGVHPNKHNKRMVRVGRGGKKKQGIRLTETTSADGLLATGDWTHSLHERVVQPPSLPRVGLGIEGTQKAFNCAFGTACMSYMLCL